MKRLQIKIEELDRVTHLQFKDSGFDAVIMGVRLV